MNEIIEMAKQVGLFEITKDGYEVFYPDNLEAFAKLIAAKEREACLKICDEFPDIGHVDKKITDDYHSYLIRLRGEA